MLAKISAAGDPPFSRLRNMGCVTWCASKQPADPAGYFHSAGRSRKTRSPAVQAIIAEASIPQPANQGLAKTM